MTFTYVDPKENTNTEGLSSMVPLPPLSFTGGAAAPATSGGIGEQGNIGDVSIIKKSSLMLPILVIGGVFLFLKLRGKI